MFDNMILGFLHILIGFGGIIGVFLLFLVLIGWFFGLHDDGAN